MKGVQLTGWLFTCFPHIASLQHKKREEPHHQQHGLGLVNDYNYFNSGEMQDDCIVVKKWDLKWLFATKRNLSTANVVVWNVTLVPHGDKHSEEECYTYSLQLRPYCLWASESDLQMRYQLSSSWIWANVSSSGRTRLVVKLASVQLHNDCQGEDSCSDGSSRQAGYYHI